MIYNVDVAFFPELISCPFSGFRHLFPFLPPSVHSDAPLFSVHRPTYILVDLDLPATYFCAYIYHVSPYIIHAYTRNCFVSVLYF